MTTHSHYCPKCSRLLSIAEVIHEFCEECHVDIIPTLNPPAFDRLQIERGVARPDVEQGKAA